MKRDRLCFTFYQYWVIMTVYAKQREYSFNMAHKLAFEQFLENYHLCITYLTCNIFVLGF